MKLRDYAQLTPEKQAQFRKEWVRASKEPSSPQLRARLADFEQRYGMSTETMRTRFRAGELKDTADISQWLILSNLTS